MKKIFLILSTLLFASCVSTPKNLESWLEYEKNACLPTAIVYKKGLDKKSIWSKIVSYSYKDKNLGHSIVCYMHPPGENKLWTYDYLGSYRARAYKNNPLQIAREAEAARNRNKNNVKKAYFIE